MKRQGNPIEKIIKLFMNSFYGKSTIKPIDTDIKVFSSEVKFKKYMLYNHTMVEETRHICNKYFVKIKKAINDHFNFCHAGCEILSMSKRIMSRVMCLAEELDILIFYQDTDSMHIESDKVELLAKEFYKKYKQELIGEDGCQFHVDFDMFNQDGDKLKTKTDINSIEAYFLCKKNIY